MSYVEAQQAATAKYNRKAYDQIHLFVPKGRRAVIKEFAQRQGKSVNAFILELVDKAMEEG